MSIFTNTPLIASIIAIVFAQVVKVPIHILVYRKFNLGLMFSTGGMPSSHSAAVTALMTTLAIEYGLDSPYFAISVVFGIIVMFDATGVRRQAGEQEEKTKHLKELLGHKPMEVFFGALTGIAIGFILEMFM